MHTACPAAWQAGVDRMFELASTPRDLGEILVQGIQLGRLAFRRLFMLTSMLAFLSLVPTACLVWGAGDQTISMTDLNQMLERLKGPYGWAMLAALLLSLPLRAILLRRVAAASRGQTESMQEDLRNALRAWPWLLVAGIVYAMAVGLGTLLLIAPGLILAISLMFWEYGIVLEGNGPIQALNRSHNLVWGHWWRTLGMLLLVFVPPWMLLAVLSGGLGLDNGNPNDLSITGRDLFEQGVLEMVFISLLGPFIYSVLYVYYHDLKLRKQDI